MTDNSQQGAVATDSSAAQFSMDIVNKINNNNNKKTH